MLDVEKNLEEFTKTSDLIRRELGKALIGQSRIIDDVLSAFFGGSHILLEGVPGLGKTLLVKSFARVLGLPFARIQFTPDLMPSDILGTTVVSEGERGERVFSFKKGPIFSSVVLADEINRATPKTQSALLEAMQERTVTTSGTTYDLGKPYFVLATQNPLEMEGTYPLPEAQLDRFFMKVIVPFPSESELLEIVTKTTGATDPELEVVASREKLLELLTFVRSVPVPSHVTEAVVRLVLRTHPDDKKTTSNIARFVKVGASPRGAQSLLLAAKIRALFAGRVTPSLADVADVVSPTLRHRLLLNFEGQADQVGIDTLLEELASEVLGRV